jgi:hypothetical protein
MGCGQYDIWMDQSATAELTIDCMRKEGVFASTRWSSTNNSSLAFISIEDVFNSV